VRNAVRLLATAGPSPQADALKDAILTDRSQIPAQTKKRLEMLIGKYLA
jgi:5'-methylthioadenosine phosphorylase